MSGLDRLLLDHTEQMIFLVEPESLRIVEANRVAAQTLGYEPERLLDMSILDIESALQDIFYWEDVRSGQIANIESQEALYLCADGSMRPAAKTVRLVEQDGRRWLMVQAREISDELRIEDTLARTTSQLRATLESTGNGILVIDWQGEVIVDVDPRTVAHEGPVYERPMQRPARTDAVQADRFTGSSADTGRPEGEALGEAVLERDPGHAADAGL